MPRADAAAVERAVRAFAAALIGQAAHDLNNRLAVMRETLGLVEDLEQAGRGAAAGTKRARAALGDQLGRTLNIARVLSGLGAALGPAAGDFAVGETLAVLLGLSEGWARQRNLRVDLSVADSLPRAGGDPGLFLCLIQRLLERCAGTLHPGGSILVRVVRDGAAIRVSLSGSGERAARADEPADAGIDAELARRLGGELHFEGEGAATLSLAASPGGPRG